MILSPTWPFCWAGKAFIDLISQYGWESITILYENNDSMMRLKEIFDITSEVSAKAFFQKIGQPQPIFVDFRLFVQIILVASRIQIRIIRVEGQGADH